jgi:hypothetical protein
MKKRMLRTPMHENWDLVSIIEKLIVKTCSSKIGGSKETAQN